MRRIHLALVLALLGSALGACAAVTRLAAGYQPEAVERLHPTGELPAGTPMRLAMGLPLQNSRELADLLRRLYDPVDPKYHRFLTPQLFAARFGPSEEQYQAVIAFAQAHHLTIAGTHPNRMLLDVSGSAADVGRAFHVRLLTYQHPSEARDFFAPDAEPAVEGHIPILDISGLNNYRLPHPMIRKVAPLTVSAAAQPRDGSASGGAYFGPDFRAAYVPGVALNGAGQSVGLVEFDGFYPNDISNYQSQAGLPAVPVQLVLIDGFSGFPTGNIHNNSEVSLDIEMAMAMAPGLSNIICYEAGATNPVNDVLNRMADDNAAAQLGCSWGWGGGPAATTDQIFQEMAAQGQTFLCASGDNDAYPAGAIDNAASANAPSDSPYLTVVGGTTLTTSGPAGSWVSESVWNWGGGTGSGGGASSYYPIASWQQGVNMQNNGGSTSMRNIPDVALTADNIYVMYDNGGAGVFGGTSCATALWAGFMALVNQRAADRGLTPAGFINPALYQIGAGLNYAADFHDVTLGNNISSSSPSAYYATTGFDLCTGWGTPGGYNLINALTAPPDPLQISPVAGFTSTGLGGGPFDVSAQTLVLTNAGSNALAWSLASDAAWLGVSPANGVLPPGAPAATVTATLNAAANSLIDGSHAAAVWITNLTTGNVQNRQFKLQVQEQLVQNGGFETGGLNGWTYVGNATYVSVTFSTPYVHSGMYGLQLGPSGALGFLSQTVPTVPGLTYLLSFWLDNPKAGTPNEFNVSWNGSVLFDETNLPALDWTNLQFAVVAPSTNSVLQFGVRDDPAYFGLDDISLWPLVPPALRSFSAQSALVRFSWNAVVGLVYQIQYTTNLAQTNWINLSAPFTATNATATFQDSAAQDAQRFYRILVVP
jgi:hypothetical protein